MLLDRQLLADQLARDLGRQIRDLISERGLRLVALDADLRARPGDHLLGFLARSFPDLARDPLAFRHRVLDALAAFLVQLLQMGLVVLADLLDFGLLHLDALELRFDLLPALAHRGKDDRVERAAHQEEKDDETDRVRDELIDVYELVHESSLSRSDPGGRTS